MVLRARAFLVPILLAFVASGCMGPEEVKPEVDSQVLDEVPGLRIENLPSVEVPRTLEAPPQWRLGEWWKVRLTDEFDHQATEGLRVVAGAQDDNYLVGMPQDAFLNSYMVLHIPGYGEVSRADLSFEVHDVPFGLLNFPLVTGKTWQSAFEGRPITVTVKETRQTEAGLQFDGASDHGNATYDVRLGELRRLQINGYATLEVLEHGANYRGIVTVPHMHDLVFVQVRFGLLFGGQGLAPTPLGPLNPSLTDTVEVDPTYDRVSFALFVGTLPNPVTGQFDLPNAVYKETAKAPDGTVFEVMATAADPPGLHLKTFMFDQPDGTWTFEHLAGGPGFVVSEGIAYHVYDVVLPEGRILPSTGQHRH